MASTCTSISRASKELDLIFGSIRRRSSLLQNSAEKAFLCSLKTTLHILSKLCQAVSCVLDAMIWFIEPSQENPVRGRALTLSRVYTSLLTPGRRTSGQCLINTPSRRCPPNLLAMGLFSPLVCVPRCGGSQPSLVLQNAGFCRVLAPLCLTDCNLRPVSLHKRHCLK